MARRYALDDSSVIVVIGSGAGGGTLSNELAQKGIDVVCLEAGPRLQLSDLVNDPSAMHMKLSWLDKRLGAPTWLCKTVGGTTVRWSGMTPRFQAHEFKPRSTYGKLDDTTAIDWPITLEELAPYYDKAEYKMGVSGTHGMPPSAETNEYKVLKAAAKKVGYREYTSSRAAINSIARDGRPACRQIGFCWSGCAIGAKWSTLYTEIPKAESTDHFELRSECMALKVEHDRSGKVTGVVYVDKNGDMHEQKARAVCVAGNVIETTRLLHNSASNSFPDGLANSSGHLGRNYMRHATATTMAIMPGEVNFHRGPRQSGLIFDEQYHQPERDFAGGYLIESAASDPLTVALTVGGWGERTVDYLENYTRLAATWVTGEDPPQASNRITFHETERDQYGLPVPVLHYEFHANSNAMLEHAAMTSRKLLESVGGRNVYSQKGGGGGCHNMGVARMSADPEDGVTNRWGQAHDVSNLFVSDGSVFASSAAANPTLTIVALAIRQAGHIAERLGRKEL
ncbi:MAG: GMC family oxidoreductase [Woeseiaceae bacterium]|nr:GMC family oxidoreductase [Woeseiaceae bacterium]